MSLPRKGHLGATVHVGSTPTPPQKKPNKEMQKKIDFAINLIRKAAEWRQKTAPDLFGERFYAKKYLESLPNK